MAFWDFLFGGKTSDRDGSSPEKAVIVQSVGEEYAWMARHYPGFRPQMQALQDIEGRPYDVLTFANDRGDTCQVYFDISSFYGKI